MFVLLPLLFFTLTFISLCLRASQNTSREYSRGAYLSASVIWGLAVAGSTELLSAFNLITYDWLLGFWVCAAILASLTCLVLVRNRKAPYCISAFSFARFDTLLLLAVISIVLVTGIIAFVASPNTWDSMTYHLSRVQHWIQNRNVAFYPTNIERQLYLGPWAEYAILQLQILSGVDYFANLVQWCSMIGSLLGVSLITKNLGIGAKGQILAAVASATIPMGILQASSTQNDYVVTFWLVCFAYYITRSIKSERPDWFSILGAATSLGLAILTKATAYIFAVPFLVWFAWVSWKKHRWESIKSLFVIAIVSLSMNFGQYQRVFELYGSPLGTGEESYANELFTIPSFASNIIRNVGLHIHTPIEPVNDAIERGVKSIHTVLGISIDDPRTTWPGTQFHINNLSLNEDTTGNPFHLMLIWASIVLVLLWRPKPQYLGSFAVAVTAAFLLFCFYLKWQPWNSRLHLPFFVLWSPMIGGTLGAVRSPKFGNAIAAGLVLLALPWMFFNHSRPIIGQDNIFNTSRINQYFIIRQDLTEPYIGATEFLSSQECAVIGLSLGVDDWEYPFWALMKKDTGVFRIEHYNVKNASAEITRLESPSFSPCAIISLDPEPSERIVSKYGVYSKGWFQSPVSVYVRQ